MCAKGQEVRRWKNQHLLAFPCFCNISLIVLCQSYFPQKTLFGRDIKPFHNLILLTYIHWEKQQIGLPFWNQKQFTESLRINFRYMLAFYFNIVTSISDPNTHGYCCPSWLNLFISRSICPKANIRLHRISLLRSETENLPGLRGGFALKKLFYLPHIWMSQGKF